MAWLNPEAKPDEAYDFRLYLNDARLFTNGASGGEINFTTRAWV